MSELCDDGNNAALSQQNFELKITIEYLLIKELKLVFKIWYFQVNKEMSQLDNISILI